MTLLENLGLRGLGLGVDAHALFVHFGFHDLVGLLRSLVAVGAGEFGFLLGFVTFLEHAGRGDLLGGFGAALGLGLIGGEIGVGLGDDRLGGVLTTLGLGLRVRHPDGLLALGLGAADGAALVFLRDFDLRVVDGAGGGFLAERVDVARLVFDVADVAVDHAQTDFVQLDLDALGDGGDELFAVVVDLLDGHRGEHDAHLAHDDFGGELLNLVKRTSEQARGGVLHHLGIGGDADRERRRRIDADVLAGERAPQLDVERDGREVEILVALQNRHHKGRATMVASGREAAGDLAVNHQDFIRRTHAIAR